MRKFLIFLILAACHDDLAMEHHCKECREEGHRTAEVECFRARCNDQCKPAPGVADTSAPEVKLWQCGCLPVERKP